MTRDELVQRARYVPKTVFAAVMAVGYLLFIGGVAALIHRATVGFDPQAWVVDWRLAVAAMVGGGVLLAVATWRERREFRDAARAAGYSPAQIRDIEQEAARLNAEED